MMRKLIIATVLFIANQTVFAQNKQLQFSVGPSRHGSGDLKGISYSVDYSKYFKKKLSWQIVLGTDIYDGFTPIYFVDPSGNKLDLSYRYTTAGTQLGLNVRYSFIKTVFNELFISAGGIIRYQTSSVSDGLNILYSPITNVPFPVIVLENTSPQRTVSIGATPKIGYNYTFNKKLSLGIVSGFQFDTNGDTILQLLLGISRRF